MRGMTVAGNAMRGMTVAGNAIPQRSGWTGRGGGWWAEGGKGRGQFLIKITRNALLHFQRQCYIARLFLGCHFLSLGPKVFGAPKPKKINKK